MKKVISRLHTFAACAALAIPSAMFAQQIALNNDMPSAPNVSSSTSGTTLNRPASPAPAIPVWETNFDRWVDLNTFNYGSRYRSTFASNGARSFDQGQQRLLLDGKFKFDEQGRYGIGFHLSSGHYFNWAYADFIGGGQREFIQNVTAKMNPYQLSILNFTPVAPGFYSSGGTALYFRQAFLTAQPIHGVEAQFGGIGINHGVNTEANSYDDDGYLSGERLSIKRPQNLLLSEVSYTRAYLGDLYTPNFFVRGQRLAVSNYWQVLGRKDFGKRVAVSADYTYSQPEGAAFFLKTTREAIYGDVHESKAFDSVRFEAYQRLNAGQYVPGFLFSTGKGWALTLSSHIKKTAYLDAGVADIDTGYVNNLGLNTHAILLGLSVNGDQYGVGKRYFVRPTIPLTKTVSLVGNFSQMFNTNLIENGITGVAWNDQALTAGFVVDAKKMFFHSPAVH